MHDTRTTKSDVVAGSRDHRLPLPELQPFYGVVDWGPFNGAKRVKKTIRRLQRALGILEDRASVDRDCGGKEPVSVLASEEAAEEEATKSEATTTFSAVSPQRLRQGDVRNYRLFNNRCRDRTFRCLDEYQTSQHGSNWLTPTYFEMMKRANEDPTINFTLHTIELYLCSHPATHTEEEEEWLSPNYCFPSAEEQSQSQPHLDNSCPPPGAVMVAGEIGYSIGRIYTSLSGFSSRAYSGVGTDQLVILGRWLQHKGYAFWSLGHCYSPEMDYKRQLGHRIYPLSAFRGKVCQHRGDFRLDPRASGTAFHDGLRDGEECDVRDVLSHTP
eukprot:CAMPEP_0185751192 /NCGR_PEP_ID=MMETSP1174-20130828/9952_1 /TAXON_ID=35687 /ORGANISM="Dictyocha speculum, Strain CCMP1381" /LENGTH=327 /DNA_ID=CAMNT_0028428055 /DNA_START=59 /DNA_END=1043 /DNA_ORIENTATION=+